MRESGRIGGGVIIVVTNEEAVCRAIDLCGRDDAEGSRDIAAGHAQGEVGCEAWHIG